MQLFFTKYKRALGICGVILMVAVSAVCGAIVGMQYFYQDFLTAKVQFKETFGIVTEADLAVLATQEAEAADAQAAAAEQIAADEQAAIDATFVRTITINGQETAIDLLAETFTWFDAAQMSAETENTFVFGDFSGYDVVFEGESVSQGSSVSISLDSLSQGSGLSLEVTNQETGEKRQYYIRTLHAGYNSVAAGQGEGDGYYYFTTQNEMYKIDTAGNVVFYKVESGTVRDFKQTIVDGVCYYSYVKYADADAVAAAELVTPCNFQAIVLNESYQIIDYIPYLLTDEGVSEGCLLDEHEFLILGENHYIIGSYVYQNVDNVPSDLSADGTAYVQATVVQEIKDGALLFQWCSTEYPELYGYSVRASRLGDETVTNAIDYMHYNSTAIDPTDGNFVFSFRSLSALIKVDRETGDILWVLGGEGDMFGLTETQKMSYQHYPLFWDADTITVFDNGTDYAQTRALEYVIDQETLTLVSFASYQIDGLYAAAMGSAERLSADSALYLMCWGQVAADNCLFTEIDFDTGEVLFQLFDFDCEDDFLASSYRAYKSAY